MATTTSQTQQPTTQTQTYAVAPTINTSLIFGDKTNADLQDQAAYDALNSLYSSSFDTTMPVQEKSDNLAAAERSRWGTFRTGMGSMSPDLRDRQLAAADTLGSQTRPVLAGQLFNEMTLLARDKPSTFASLQSQLYLGGFYGKTKLENIASGTLDDTSYSALANLFDRTARLNAALKEQGRPTVSWQDVLNQQVSQMSPIMEQFAKTGGSSVKITLADPAALADAIDSVAQQTLGRRASAEEQRMFVSGFHAMQSSAQGATSGTVVEPDAQGQAKQLLADQNPNEKAGYDLLNTFGNFVKIMGG